MTATSASVPAAGSAACVTPSARPRLTRAAIALLKRAIATGSAPEILRVRLLSTPQATAAAATHSGPASWENDGDPDHASAIDPSTMSPTPNTVRRELCSWKTAQAIDAVATVSRFSSKEDVAGVVR